MTVLTTVAQYSYWYGAGTSPNRRIDFIRNGSAPENISACVTAIFCGEEKIISQLQGDEINVEMMPLSEKMKVLIAGREGKKIPQIPDQKLSQLTLEDQDQILTALAPIGSWKIEITNGFGQDPRFERIAQLNLYNPN